MLLFEHLNTPTAKPLAESGANSSDVRNNAQKSHIEKLASVSEEIKKLYYAVCDFIESLGDDIVSNQLKLYLAYKKVRNMVCIEIYSKQIILFLKLNPETVDLQEGFTRDMRNIGHYGTGDLQVTIKNVADFEKAKPLLERAYHEA